MSDDKDEKAAAEAAQAKALADATAGLKKKNDELLGKLKARDKEMSEIRAQLDALAADKDALDTDAATKAGDWEKLRERMEAKHKAELEKLTSDLESERGFARTTLIDNGLTEALSKANVAPHFMDATRALIRASADISIESDGTKRAAMIGHQPLAEYVAEWAQGDAGKHYVQAPVNSGSDAQGAASTQGDGKSMNRKTFEGLNPAEQSKLAREGVSLTD